MNWVSFFALGVFLSSLSWAGEVLYRFNQPRCSGYQWKEGKWVFAAPIADGTEVHGQERPSTNPAEVAILFQQDQVVYAFPRRCFQVIAQSEANGNVESRDRQPATGKDRWAPHPSPHPSEEKVFTLDMALESWLEPVTLKGSVQSYTLRSAALGVSMGADWRIPLDPPFEFNLGAGFLYAQANLASQIGQTTGSIVYQAQNVTVLALKLEPGLYWVMTPKTSIGLGVPLAFRVGKWPIPAEGYQISQFDFLPGALISARFSGDLLVFSPKIGFLKDFTGLYWVLQFGWRL